MAVNRDKVDIWKADVAKSVDFYNNWFMAFAPKAFRDTRVATTHQVEQALQWTENLTNIRPDTLKGHPSVLSMLRMATCPPIARDRLIGLAGVSPNLVKNMEIDGRIPPQMHQIELNKQLDKIGSIIEKMADPDIFVWKNRGDTGSKEEIHRASTIVADRLCGAVADPIIRNAQEKRQLSAMKKWLELRGYRQLEPGEAEDWLSMPNGTFSFRLNVPIQQGNEGKKVNIPVDIVIMRKDAKKGDFPALFEAKSAGDFTNTNKRRKEEAVKIQQLRHTYGNKITFDLFLCGYFDSGYLGYEAAEGIDWVWEHRIDDLEKFGF
ncbi:XamI family restriction endonuclease [Aeromonas allosaccharophila]|uniref:XamI family restriction endonuclease n=1 Tax=Aeromonas allosaccharophila TaxID=656 RepID=UPI000DD08FDA|nr:XamI family restriction endonuclease [Aeromonas allosaccharophila]